MLALSCKDPSWKHLLTSLTIVKWIPGILVAASNAFVDRGGPEVGKSLKPFIRHPVICLCATGKRGLVHDVGRSIALVMSSMQGTCPPSCPGTATWHAGIYCASSSQSELEDCGCPAKQASGDSLCCLFELSVVTQEAKERGKSNLRTADWIVYHVMLPWSQRVSGTENK